MLSCRPLILTLLTITISLSTGCSRPVTYANDVFPILEKYCLECHKKGTEAYVATEFGMETYEDFMQGTKYGSVVKPGEGFASTLTILVKHKADPALNMPHGEQPLSELEIKTIKVWIDEGAKNN
jgi:hypothetical protein